MESTKKKKHKIQKVQINLYVKSPKNIPNFSRAVSRGAFSSKSAHPSPSPTPGSRTPMRMPSQNRLQPQITARDNKKSLQQSIQNKILQQFQPIKLANKSTPKFHSRQNSIVKAPSTKRSISPAQIYGQIQSLRINPLQKPQKSKLKISTDINKIPNLYQINTTKSPSMPLSNIISPKVPNTPILELNSEESKSYEEEKKLIICYFKQYFNKHLTMPETTPQFYDFIKLIGKGGFAKVALAKHKLTGMEVAIKTINKKKIRNENHKRRIMQEAQMLKRMNHENILKCYEIFETKKYVMIVIEYCPGGSLQKLLKASSQLKEDQRKHIFKQLAKAVHYVHFNGILHRDIKPGNILIVQKVPKDLRNYYPDIKLCDFGTSTYVNYGETIHRQCGTPSYIAPEIAADNGYEGFNSDI